MRIKKMTACFGRLDDETIMLQDGLNIISSPNESGKSTWCSFIKSMLYGIDSSAREKNGVKPDKVKFAPVNGKPMGGEMEIEIDGKHITLARTTKSANAPMREFLATYTGTNTAVANLNGIDCAETLLGMSKPVFERSVFVSQNSLSVDSSPDLEKRINSITSTGEEGMSYTQADAFLRQSLRKRRFNKTGALPQIEAEIDSVKRERDAIAEDSEESARLTEQLSKAIAQRENASEEAVLTQKSQSDALSGKFAAFQDEIKQLEAHYFAAREKTAVCAAEAKGGPFGSLNAQETKAACAEGLSEEMPKQKALSKFWPLFLVLTVAFVLLSFFYLISILAAIVMLAVTAYAFFSGRKAKVEQKDYEDNLHEKYAAPDKTGIKAMCDEHLAALESLEEASNAQRVLSKQLDEKKAQLEKLQAQMMRQSSAVTSSPTAALDAQIEGFRHSLAVIEGRFSSLGDPMVLKTKLFELKAKQKALQDSYDSIALAIETLAEANTTLQARFSPQLGAKASEIMAFLTDGKYDKLMFDESFASSAKGPDDSRALQSGYLSAGALDQVYLSLRLAICDLALPEGNSCPIVLDDALCCFDDERMKRAIDYLSLLSKRRQVILFSCHKREKEYLDSIT